MESTATTHDSYVDNSPSSSEAEPPASRSLPIPFTALSHDGRYWAKAMLTDGSDDETLLVGDWLNAIYNRVADGRKVLKGHDGGNDSSTLPGVISNRYASGGFSQRLFKRAFRRNTRFFDGSLRPYWRRRYRAQPAIAPVNDS